MKALRPFLPLLILTFLLGVVLTAVQEPQELRRRAAPATTLSFSPSSVSVRPGDTFALAVRVDTGDNTISAADIRLSFDQTKLAAEEMVASDFLPVVLVAGSTSPGKATIVLGSQPTSPKKGSGTLATVKFRATALPTTNTTVNFADGTQVAGLGEQGNVLTGKTLATVTITSLEQGISPVPTIRHASSGQPVPPTGNNPPIPPPRAQQPFSESLPVSSGRGFGQFLFGQGGASIAERSEPPAALPIAAPLSEARQKSEKSPFGIVGDAVANLLVSLYDLIACRLLDRC